MIAEFAAVKSLLEAVPLLSGSVRDADMDDKEPARGTYLLVFPAAPEVLSDGRWGSVPLPESDADYSFPVRAVSTDVDGVMLIANAVKGLVGSKVTVSGRKCDPLTVDFDPIKKDNSVSPALFFMNMWIEFTSRRA